MTDTGPPAPPEVVEDCTTREVLDRVGDKWSVLVIVLLGQRTHRFNELHRAIDGISQRMLTLTVRALSATGWRPGQCTPACRPGSTTN